MVGAKAYPAYRAPRMRWLPPVPEHWIEQRAKTFYREADNARAPARKNCFGVAPDGRYSAQPEERDDVQVCKLCRLQAVPSGRHCNQYTVGVDGRARRKQVCGYCQSSLRGLSPAQSRELQSGLSGLPLAHPRLRRRVHGRSTGIRASRLRLYPNQFLDIALLQPPRHEQDQIVAYLRAQDAQIARFIKAKRDLIGLMAEQRSVIAEQAVLSKETQYPRLDRVVSLLMTPIKREPQRIYTPIGMFNRGRGISTSPPRWGDTWETQPFSQSKRATLFLAVSSLGKVPSQ